MSVFVVSALPVPVLFLTPAVVALAVVVVVLVLLLLLLLLPVVLLATAVTAGACVVSRHVDAHWLTKHGGIWNSQPRLVVRKFKLSKIKTVVLTPQ